MPINNINETNRLLNELLESINNPNENNTYTSLDSGSTITEGPDNFVEEEYNNSYVGIGNGRRHSNFDFNYNIPPLPHIIRNHSINISNNFLTYLESIYNTDNINIINCKSIRILADFLLNRESNVKFNLLNEKIFKGVKSIKELPDGYVNFNGNQQMKLGRILNGIWKIINNVNSYDESYYIERVINIYKSWNYNKKEFNFKYLEGADILNGYSRNKQIYNSSTLRGSCMNDKFNYLKLYTKNIDKLSLLVLIDKLGHIHGRALVWELDDPSLVFMDRIYVSKDSIENVFIKYARDHNMIYRTSAADDWFDVFIPKGDGKYERKCNKKYRMNIKLKTKGIKYYPYMDSLNIKTKRKIFTNKLGFNIIVRYNKLQGTGGNISSLKLRILKK